MLEENARVALMISESLRDQTIQMGLFEMETLLSRFVFLHSKETCPYCGSPEKLIINLNVLLRYHVPSNPWMCTVPVNPI